MELVTVSPREEHAPIEANMSRAAVLQDALWEVTVQERFTGMTNAEIVGVLEYLKFNIINGSK